MVVTSFVLVLAFTVLLVSISFLEVVIHSLLLLIFFVNGDNCILVVSMSFLEVVLLTSVVMVVISIVLGEGGGNTIQCIQRLNSVLG